jgi:hypothetical protein
MDGSFQLLALHLPGTALPWPVPPPKEALVNQAGMIPWSVVAPYVGYSQVQRIPDSLGDIPDDEAPGRYRSLRTIH